MIWCRTQMHRLGARSLLALVLPSLVGTFAAGYAAAAGSGQGKPDARLRELLTLRYEVLQRMVKNAQTEVEAGRADVGALQNLTAAMYRAQADLCTTAAERVRVYEKLVEAVTSQEKTIQRQADAGLAVGTQLAQGKLVMLDAQIDLERLRLGQAASRP